MHGGKPCAREGCENTLPLYARPNRTHCLEPACERLRAQERAARAHRRPRLLLRSEKRRNGNGNGHDSTSSWYGAGGTFRVFHGLTKAEKQLRHAYLHQKAMFEFCECGFVLRGDSRRELAAVRRRHLGVCIAVHCPDDWSVKAVIGR